MTGSRILEKKERHKRVDDSSIIYILVFDSSDLEIHVMTFGCFYLLSSDRVVVDSYESVDVSLVV